MPLHHCLTTPPPPHHHRICTHPQVSVQDKGGLWRDVGSQLQQTLAAAGVSAAATSAIRFRIGAGAAAARGQRTVGRNRELLRKAVGVVVFAVKAVLVLEAAGWLLEAAARRRRARGRGGAGGGASGSESDDPADKLMAFLTGKADESVLMDLNTEQMGEAVDALDTSDMEELVGGVGSGPCRRGKGLWGMTQAPVMCEPHTPC
jgi:hypothetical protein